MQIKEKKYLRDKIVNIILTDESCREYVESIISAALNIPLEIVKDNLILETNRINYNTNLKYNYVDAIYENNTSIINIEINYNNSKSVRIKNMRYVCHLLLKEANKKHQDIKPIYQININNYDIFNKNRFIYKSIIMESEIHKVRYDYLSIIDINVDILSNMNYNEIKEDKESLEYLLYIFVNDNNKELDRLYLNNKIMENVREKLSVLSEDFMEGLYYDREELLNEASFEEGMERGMKEGLEKGLEEGKAKKTKEIAKNLLKLNMSIKDIITATNLSKEEIESLIET